jgi:hypothetical protein
MTSSTLIQLNARYRIEDGGQWVLARLDDRWGWVTRADCRTLEHCVYTKRTTRQIVNGAKKRRASRTKAGQCQGPQN